MLAVSTEKDFQSCFNFCLENFLNSNKFFTFVFFAVWILFGLSDFLCTYKLKGATASDVPSTIRQSH